MQLNNKVAIVTGAARGLGRAYAEALAAEGAAVVAADINDCHDTVTAIEASGGRALAATLNVSDSDSCAATAALAVDAFGRIDVLINNAALYAGLQGARFENLDERQWDQVMQVNIKGTWLTSRAVLVTCERAVTAALLSTSPRLQPYLVSPTDSITSRPRLP